MKNEHMNAHAYELEKSKLRSKEINDYMKKGGKTKNDCSE
jgi:hypothetical protein